MLFLQQYHGKWSNMNIKKVINIFYIIYTIYIIMVINTTSLTFFMIFPAIAVMWINFFVFSLGYSINRGNNIPVLTSGYSNSWLLNRNKISLLIIALFSILFSIAAVKYYTGQTPLSTFENLANNYSLYSQYQYYFREQQRYIFSLKKIPFVFMLFYIKLIVFYSYVSFLIVKEKTTKFDKFYLILVTLAHVYFGLARGTNYEFFELLILIIFVILSKSIKLKKSKLPLAALFKIFLLGSLMIFIFYIGISARGVNFNNYISQDVQYDPNGVLPLLSPFLSFITIIIFGYFGFGFFYISTYVSELWFSSIGNFIAGFLPLGYYAFRVKNIPNIMRNLVDMGARWHPDVALIINYIGYLGLLMSCFLIGIFAKHLYNTKSKGPIIYFTSFIILLQMISLPVGNFISTSSASKLIVALLLIVWVWKLFIKEIIKL